MIWECKKCLVPLHFTDCFEFYCIQRMINKIFSILVNLLLSFIYRETKCIVYTKFYRTSTEIIFKCDGHAFLLNY